MLLTAVVCVVFLFLGSTCIYPKHAPQPIQESALLESQLEPTNEAYALAKIAGLKLCQYYRKQFGALYHSAMPTNLYGPGDNYHPQHSHVLPALLRRIHEAHLAGDPEVVIWAVASHDANSYTLMTWLRPCCISLSSKILPTGSTSALVST